MGQYKLPEKWDSWPTKDISIGGVKRKAKVDPETNAAYLLDERGEWTGKQGYLPTPAINAGDTTTAENTDDTPDAAPKLTKKVRKKGGTNPLLIGIIIVLAILLLFKGNGKSGSGKTYDVIIAMENIQPGEYIGEKLSAATITEEEYRKYISEGGLYSPDEYEQIQFYVATAFIPKDGCITYTNVGEEYNKSNPWMMETQQATITIPIDAWTDTLDDYIWGNEISLKVTARRTMSSANYPGSEHPEAPGAEITSKLETVQVNTYLYQKLTIVDVLDKSGNSLYSRFASQAAIPTLYLSDCVTARYESYSDVVADMPTYIVIAVSHEVHEWWVQIGSSLYTRTYEISVTGANCATELQANTYDAMQKLVEAMKPIWNGVEENA